MHRYQCHFLLGQSPVLKYTVKAWQELDFDLRLLVRSTFSQKLHLFAYVDDFWLASYYVLDYGTVPDRRDQKKVPPGTTSTGLDSA